MEHTLFEYFYPLRSGSRKRQKELSQDLVSLIVSGFNSFKQRHQKLIHVSKKVSSAFVSYISEGLKLEGGNFQINWTDIESKYLEHSMEYINLAYVREDLKKAGHEIIRRTETSKSNEELITLYLANEHTLIKIALYKRKLALRERLVLNTKTQLAKVNIITNSIVQVYLKGFSEPECILFKDYHHALKFVEALTVKLPS